MHCLLLFTSTGQYYELNLTTGTFETALYVPGVAQNQNSAERHLYPGV